MEQGTSFDVVVKEATENCAFAPDNYGAMCYAAEAKIALLQAAFGTHFIVGQCIIYGTS